MAIFTTLRLTVVLSTILPSAPSSFSANNVWLLVNSYPFPWPTSIPRHLPWLATHFRTVLLVLIVLSTTSRQPSVSPSLQLLSSLACVSSPPLTELISFNGSAHLPLNVSQTPLPLQPHLANTQATSKTCRNFSWTSPNSLKRIHNRTKQR